MSLLRVVSIFVMLIMTLSMFSCAVTSHDYNVEISCDEFRASNHRSGEFDVEVGDKIRLELCSNQTTGFQWDYETTRENIVKLEDQDYEEAKEGLMGAAGVE